MGCGQSTESITKTVRVVNCSNQYTNARIYNGDDTTMCVTVPDGKKGLYQNDYQTFYCKCAKQTSSISF